MKKLTNSKILIIMLIIFVFKMEAYAQIQDIKKKSSNNKSKSSSSSSSTSSDDDWYYSDDVIDSGGVDCCTGFISLIGWNLKNPGFSLDISAISALLYHKGIDKIYTYVDYLPEIRAHVGGLSMNFRYNILTEYTDDYPDSFKSWELMVMLNLAHAEDFAVFVGSGLIKEEFSNKSFHACYIGAKIPLFIWGKYDFVDYIDIETRFCIDYDTEAYPFFEFSSRYNKRFLRFEHLDGFISLGITYQNYYTSHDILGFNGGIIFSIH